MMSSAEALKAGLRGKALRVMHYYRDSLWESAEGRHIPNGGFLEDIIIEDPSLHDAVETVSDKNEQQLDVPVVQAEQDTGSLTANSKNDEEMTEYMTRLNVSESCSIEEQNESKEHLTSSTDIDALLDSCILQALHTFVKVKDLPLLGSILWSLDSGFYSEPRFVTHIDDPAIFALTKYYQASFPPSNAPGVCLLDLCSSWVSHYSAGYRQDRIVGMGLNEDELKQNRVLTEYIVQDLNVNPKLPFDDNSFDVITNVVSVDYLTKPIDVFKEMQRILKPEGLAIISFSNRCFWTKAISIWTSTGDADHAWIVGSYFHYAGGFEQPVAMDISPNVGRSDPMYIVYSRKKASA